LSPGSDSRAGRVAFVFSSRMNYPPDIHNMKVYYLSQAMVKRGVNVTWVQIGGRERRWASDGIQFVSLTAPRGARLSPVARLSEWVRVLRLALYCILDRIQLVYFDEWLFLRNRPFSRLVAQMILRLMGIKVVLDQRDPYVDFELASGELRQGSLTYRWLSWVRPLILRQTDLIVVPSEAYATLYLHEGVPRTKVLGVFRGIDTALFNVHPDPSTAKSRLGLKGKFVIGWFGLMQPYRMINEIIVPLIQNLSKDLPNAHVLIGGEGPLLNEFQSLLRSEARKSFTLLGSIPYSELPGYIAACDVTICPVSTEFRFTTHSNWLKIAESISVGIPIVSTKTDIADMDFKGVRGVIWAGSNYGEFLRALREVQSDPRFFRLEAEEQASNFEPFSIAQTIPKIVDKVLHLIEKPT
jgi:glycosyltransferase involved in cell wall biosynthesis